MPSPRPATDEIGKSEIHIGGLADRRGDELQLGGFQPIARTGKFERTSWRTSTSAGGGGTHTAWTDRFVANV